MPNSPGAKAFLVLKPQHFTSPLPASVLLFGKWDEPCQLWSIFLKMTDLKAKVPRDQSCREYVVLIRCAGRDPLPVWSSSPTSNPNLIRRKTLDKNPVEGHPASNGSVPLKISKVIKTRKVGHCCSPAEPRRCDDYEQWGVLDGLLELQRTLGKLRKSE